MQAPIEPDSDDLIAAQLPQLELETQILAELAQSSKNRPPPGLSSLDVSLLDSKQKRKLDHLKSKLIQPDSKRSKPLSDPSESPLDPTTLQPAPTHPTSTLDAEYINIPTYPGLQMPKTLFNHLYPFQREGVSFLARQFSKNSGALLAHDLGLGKTLQTVSFLGSLLSSGSLNGLSGIGKILIITPSTIISQWVLEFNKYFPGSAISSDKDPEVTSDVPVHVVSYELLRSKQELYINKEFAVIVADEAQRLRNPFSQTTQVLKSFRTPLRIALSGTPIQNNLQELWSIMDFVKPGVLGSLAVFNEELAKPVEVGCRATAGVKEAQRAYRAALLITQLVDPYLHKKSKYDVQGVINLPEKHEQVLFVHMDFCQYTVYCEVLKEAALNVPLSSHRARPPTGRSHDGRGRTGKGAGFGQFFKSISVLRKLANHAGLMSDDLASVMVGTGQGTPELRGSGKLHVLLKLLRQWRSEGERVLVFSQSLKMLDIIGRVLTREGFSFARVDGSTPMTERQRLLKLLGPGEAGERETAPQVLLLTTKVFGVGTNLQFCTRVVIVCPSWNVADDAQARDRSWRIGQTKPVEVYRLISVGSIEELVYKRQIYKQHLSQKILLDPRQQGTDLFSDLREDLYKLPPAPPGYAEWVAANPGVLEALKARVARASAGRRGDESETDSDIEGLAAEGGKHEAFVAAIWNQREVETPFLSSALVDEAEMRAVEDKARRAIEESSRASTPPEPAVSPQPESHGGVSGALGRSRALLASLNTKAAEPVNTEDADMASSIQSYFRSQRKFQATSEDVLRFFGERVSTNKQLMFRACLKQLCDLKRGVWTLRNP